MKQLSLREKEVVLHICNNLSNKMIADQMKVTKKTVEGLRMIAMKKLGTHTTLETLAATMVIGWINPLEWAATLYVPAPQSATDHLKT